MNKTKERLEHISNVARIRDERLNQEYKIKRLKCQTLISQIESKSKEIFPDLFEVARSLVSHGYLLGNKPHWADSPEFCTDKVTHRLGFYLESDNPFIKAQGSIPIAFGSQAEERSEDFKINVNGKIESFNYDSTLCRNIMESYCSDLDDFCERFYAWVDSLK